MSKSQKIKDGLHHRIQNGTTGLANRLCYGYTKAPDGSLVIHQTEAAVIRRIFEQYLAGDSLGKIAEGLMENEIPSPTGKPKWSSQALHKLLSNEKYTGRVLLQKTVSVCGYQFVNDGFTNRYLYEHNHPAIISEDVFRRVQEMKQQRAKHPEQCGDMALI